MTTRLDPKLPKNHNGADTLDYENELIKNPKETRVAIIYFNCPKIIEDTFASGDHTKDPTIRIRRIEPLSGDDAEYAMETLERVYADRIGQDALPVDVEGSVKANGNEKRLTIVASKKADPLNSGIETVVGGALEDAVDEKKTKPARKKKLTVVEGSK